MVNNLTDQSVMGRALETSAVAIDKQAILNNLNKPIAKNNITDQNPEQNTPGRHVIEQRVVVQHAALVKRIAQHLMGRLPPIVQLDDLIQSGMIGLIEAIKNYDPGKGASFETYASIRIRGSMLDEIRKGDWAPRSVHRNTRKISQAIRMIENKTGRDAKDYEVAQYLNISLKEYHNLIQDTNGVKVFGFNDIGINDEMLSEGMAIVEPGPLDGLQRENFRHCLLKGIAGLPERERLVLALYYEEELNLREVGEVLGVSESRVSQIHSQAMLRLQTRLKEWNLQDELN